MGAYSSNLKVGGGPIFHNGPLSQGHGTYCKHGHGRGGGGGA